MKRSKSNRGLTQVEAIFFANKQTINIELLWQRKSTLKNIVPDCVVRSDHRIDILNAKSIIEKTVSFWNSVKKYKKSYHRCSLRKVVSRISQYLPENTWVKVSFKKVTDL